MLNRIFLKFVRGYQRWIAPFLLPACRFYPSCSEYAAQALQHHSLVRAVVLIIARIFKCPPYHEGGSDPLK